MGRLLRQKNLRKDHVDSLSEDVFHYRYAVAVTAHHCGESPSRHRSDPSEPEITYHDYADVDRKANWDPVSFNAVDSPMNDIVIKTKFTELKTACRSSDFPVQSSTSDAADLAPGLVLASMAGDMSCNGPSRSHVEEPNVQVRNNHLPTQLRIVKFQ